MRLFVVLLVFCRAAMALSGAESGAPKAPPELHSIAEILRLTSSEAEQHLPVRVRVSTTYVDANWDLGFVQDETGGIYAYQLLKFGAFEPGQLMEIGGATAAGRYTPILAVESVKVLGTAPIPSPKLISLADLNSGGMDSQYIEIQGVVQEDETSGDHRRLELCSGSDRCRVWMLTGSPSRSLLDCEVRARGVAGAKFDANGFPLDFQLYVTGATNINVVDEPSTNTFAIPVLTAHDLRRFVPFFSRDHRVHVQGVITALWPGHLLFVQDKTGSICLEIFHGPALAVGDQIEAAGFLAPGITPRLRNSDVRRCGGIRGKATVEPIAIADLSGGVREFELVQTEAKLIATQMAAPDLGCLLLQGGAGTCKAMIPGTNACSMVMGIRPGSRLRVTGVYQRLASPLRLKSDSVLWLRSPADAQVLSSPRTASEMIALWTCGVLVLAAAAAAIPIGWFRRQTRLRFERNLAEGRRQLRNSVEERERISKDLHDNIMQSVYAVGLGLEDCRRAVQKSPTLAEERLSIAIRALNGVIQDIRQFIGGLEPKVLSGSELKTALKSLALTAGDSSSQFVIQVDPVAARQLTSQQATHLLNIAKEAISNTLRHAKPRRATVALGLHDNLLRMEIADDGSGFDPQALPHQGNGLRNISSRARELGGRLEIISAPGSGTRVLVDIPLIPSHDNHHPSS